MRELQQTIIEKDEMQKMIEKCLSKKNSFSNAEKSSSNKIDIKDIIQQHEWILLRDDAIRALRKHRREFLTLLKENRAIIEDRDLTVTDKELMKRWARGKCFPEDYNLWKLWKHLRKHGVTDIVIRLSLL